jgi:hypothetical protein
MTYQLVHVNLNKNQIKTLTNAILKAEPVNLSLKKGFYQVDGWPLLVTKSLKNRMDKAQAENKGIVIKLSKAIMTETRKQMKKGELGGSGIGAVLASLAPALIQPISNILTNLTGKIFGGNQEGEGLTLPGQPGSMNSSLPDLQVSYSDKPGGDMINLKDFLSDMGLDLYVSKKKN